MKSQLLPKRSGQSLIEMMIALFMLTVAFLGIGTLLERSFFLNRVATDETIGSYLAAEGIEITKNIIDHDMYDDRVNWGLGISTSPPCYAVQYDSTSSLSSSHLGQSLTFTSNTDGHYYSYDPGGVATPFTRKICITLLTSSEIDVQSTVTWSTGPLTNETVTDEDHFYDWHPHS